MGTRLKKNPSSIYEVFCEVGIPADTTREPWIAWKYPSKYNNEEILKSLPSFAYPCEYSNSAVQHFSFVLTNVDSQWTYGFCRSAFNSSCYVILSYLPWHEVFYKILNHVAELTNKEEASKSKNIAAFLENLHHAHIPDPGLELHVLSKQEDFIAVCPENEKLPSIPENRNMTEYFNAIDSQNMMTIFASMLHERRILICSSKLCRLSACVQAANALIYPMHWQHIFIPVLPKHLSDYLSAPMPFLIGIPAATLARMKITDMGEVVFLDADRNVINTPFADLDTLPSEIVQGLRADLKKPQELLGDGVARAFLRALVQLMGGYWGALTLTDKISFSPEKFIQTRPAPMQSFLYKMLELQIFQQFIESRLKKLNAGQGVNDEFELELTAHEDKASFRLRNQYKEWVSNMKKEGGAFFKNVKSKVKVTSKKAYKDIRSMIHDIQNHTVIPDEPPDVPKRRDSAPTLNAIDLYHRKNSYKKEQLSQPLARENQNINASLPDNTAPLTPLRRSASALDSPQLTFQPIDVDLMSDLHDVIFRSCSLCSSKSEPSESENGISCGPECTASPLKHLSDAFSSPLNATPPLPLLPKPPAAKSRTIPQTPSSQLLIELDNEVTMDKDNNSLFDIHLSSSYHANSPFPSTNPFAAESAIDLNSDSNPFKKNSIIYKSYSGPNVRNMVDRLQSEYPPSLLSSSTDGLSSRESISKMSVSHSMSSPPPGSHPSSILYLKSASKVSTNPFVVADSKNNNISKSNFNHMNTSWEDFQ